MAVAQKLRCMVEHGRRSRRARLHGGAAARAPGAAVSGRAVSAPGAGPVRSDRLLARVARVLDRECARANATPCGSPTRFTAQFTARMERDLVEGREVWVKMPYGDFVIDSRTRRRAVRRRHRHYGVHGVPRGA